MDALSISAMVFACCFGGGVIGLFLHRVVPDQHLDSESKDTVKLVMGLIATMAALVLSLLIASAKSSFDAQQTGMEQLVTDVIEVDRRLDSFGPETKGIRQGLRTAMVGLHDRIWSPAGASSATLDPRAMERQYDALVDAVRALAANTDMQRSDQKAALERRHPALSSDIRQIVGLQIPADLARNSLAANGSASASKPVGSDSSV